jgi:hypothetical protein
MRTIDIKFPKSFVDWDRMLNREVLNLGQEMENRTGVISKGGCKNNQFE